MGVRPLLVRQPGLRERRAELGLEVGDVRGLGLLAGLELVRDKDSKEKFKDDDPELKTFGESLADKGLLTRVAGVLPLSPPLCITAEQVDRMVSIIDDSLTEMEAAHGFA